MDIWEKAGLNRKKQEHFCFSDGILYASDGKSTVEIRFKYELRDADYKSVDSTLIPIEHTLPTRVIYSYQTWKPFVKGAKVRLQDMPGDMIIQGIELEIDAMKAQMTGNGVKGFIITLVGG